MQPDSVTMQEREEIIALKKQALLDKNEMAEWKRTCESWKKLYEEEHRLCEHFRDMLPDNICYDHCDTCRWKWFEDQGNITKCVRCNARVCDKCLPCQCPQPTCGGVCKRPWQSVWGDDEECNGCTELRCPECGPCACALCSVCGCMHWDTSQCPGCEAFKCADCERDCTCS
jgi:hypothetical protein